MNVKEENKQRKDLSLMNKEFTVMYSDLDMTHSVTMPAMCNYIFEVGSIHGRILSEDAGLDTVFVLTRLYMKMEEYPEVEEKFSIRSWLSPITDRYVVRNVEILGRNGVIIGRAKTSAVSFNLSNRTGGGISENIMKVQTRDVEPATPHIFEKLHPVDSPLYQRSFEVSYFDCDINRHANNVKYMQWCIETMPLEFLKSHRLFEIDINFRSEGNAGDKLVSKAVSGTSPGTFRHSITTEDGERELARMSSTWR